MLKAFRRRAVTMAAVLILTTVGFNLIPDATYAAVTCSSSTFPSVLRAGETVGTGNAGQCQSELHSPSGRIRLQVGYRLLLLNDFYGGMEYDMWQSPALSVDSMEPTTLTMQTDGNLVLRGAGGRTLWATYTRGSGATWLSLQDDGNLVLRTAGNRAVWATYTIRPALFAGETLGAGGAIGVHPYTINQCRPTCETGIWSSDLLRMDHDGDVRLVRGNTVEWESHTFVAGSYLVMQTDGNLVVRSAVGRALWASGTYTFGPYASVAPKDGFFMISGPGKQRRIGG